MFLQQYQDLIDAKDWDNLRKSGLLQDLRKIILYKFDKDFILDFLLDSRTIDIIGNAYIFQFSNIISIDLLGQFKFDEKDWEDYYNKIQHPIITPSYFAGLVRFNEHKDSGFYRLILDNKKFKHILGVFKNGVSKPVVFHPKMFDGFSKDEGKLLIERIAEISVTSSFKNCDSSILANYFDTLKEVLPICKNFRISPKAIFVNQFIDVPELEDAFLSILDNLYSYGWIADELAVMLSGRALSDKFIDSVIDIEEATPKRILCTFLKKDQILLIDKRKKEKTGKTFLFTTAIFANKYFSIEDIDNLFPDLNKDISGFRQNTTEEEILKYPKFFNPKNIVKQNTRLYLTRETFKVLNKTWGTKARWDEKFISFEYLVDGGTTVDHLKYLVKKTNPSNDAILKAFKILTNVYNDPSDIKKLNIITGIIDNYSK